MAKVWIELKYDGGSGEATLARIESSRFLQAVRIYLLGAQKARVEKAEKLDLVIAFDEKVKMERLRGLMDLLIPDRPDSSNIPGGRNGDGEE